MDSQEITIKQGGPTMTDTKCKSITKTGKPCGHKPKVGFRWCVHHIAANWMVKAPVSAG